MDEKVIHETDNNRFVIYTEGKEALVEYKMTDDTMDLYHTFTDPVLRGKGLAAHVVRAAFAFAKENNLKVIPTCSFVQSFVRRYKEYNELVVQ
jgi:predicted GNAT family acetyltransferase